MVGLDFDCSLENLNNKVIFMEISIYLIWDRDLVWYVLKVIEAMLMCS